MVAPRTGAPERTLAAEQHQYRPLVVAVYNDEKGVEHLLSRWRLNDEDRAKLAEGEDLYLCLMTFGQPLQPIMIQVGPKGWEVGVRDL